MTECHLMNDIVSHEKCVSCLLTVVLFNFAKDLLLFISSYERHYNGAISLYWELRVKKRATNRDLK